LSSGYFASEISTAVAHPAPTSLDLVSTTNPPSATALINAISTSKPRYGALAPGASHAGTLPGATISPDHRAPSAINSGHNTTYPSSPHATTHDHRRPAT
jgi:hypothetical protein